MFHPVDWHKLNRSSDGTESIYPRSKEPPPAGNNKDNGTICNGVGNNMNRAELSEETFYLRRGESAYYGFSILIPNEMTDAEDWRLLTQWHSKPDVNIGEEWLNPVLACRYSEGDIIFRNYNPKQGNILLRVLITG